VHQAVSKKRPKSPKLDIPFDVFKFGAYFVRGKPATYVLKKFLWWGCSDEAMNVDIDKCGHEKLTIKSIHDSTMARNDIPKVLKWQKLQTSAMLHWCLRLGSVAGPVIQATGRSEFEDGLGSGDFVSGYSYHMSVRTRLSDHTKQTKFQSQRPNDVETPVPSISSTEVQQHRDSQYLDGWPPWVISTFKEKCWLLLLAPGVVSHREEMIYMYT
jgi:hypothetical protein